MHKLERETFAVARPVLDGLIQTHLSLTSILDGTLDGAVWVDDPDHVSLVLVEGGDAYYLAGAPDVSAATAENLERLIPDWVYLFAEAPWSGRLEKVWANPFVVPHPRVRLGLSSGQLVTTGPVPEGFELAPIDRALFERAPEGIEALHDEMDGWASPELFFERAVGFCALHDGVIVSHCLTDCVSGRRAEIGVGTEPDYRRRGLGRLVSAATLAECLRRGIDDVAWHSHASNKGSIAIALGLGLVERDRHLAHSARLPAENAGDLDVAQCRALGAHFEAAGRVISWHWYYSAAAWALAGEDQRAIDNLGWLVDSGWDGAADWLEEFWALQTLIGNPAFAAIVERQRLAEAD
jgi:GNAT superfamily N-acetyltransferase